MSATKLPILNPNEFDLWKMRIEYYFLMTDYSLWERLVRKNKLKARGTLLMALPDKHQLKFNIHKDAKTLMKAIEKRFGGNKETKKENINLKFLRSLPEGWRTHTLIWRNKTDLKDQTLDDLFNSLKIYKAEVQMSSSASTSIQNIAFVSSHNTDNTNKSVSAIASDSAVSAKVPVATLPNVDTLSNAMAMLTVRARRFLQRTGKNLRANRPTSIGFDVSKVECYNCHRKRHFARECSMMVWAAMTGAFRQRKNQPTMPSWNSPLQVLPVLTMSLPASPIYDRYHSGEGYHAVPPPYTGTFMPPKPDLVLHDAPNVNKTVHTAFNVELSPTKPDKDLSHTHRPSAPIIEDWVSDSKGDTEPEPLQNDSSFVHPNEQVKTPRPSVKTVKHSILAANHKTSIPKLKTHGNNRNRKACFVCKSLAHIIKDCDYYEKKIAQTPARNHAQRGNPQPVTTAVPQPHVTKLRHAKTVVTKPHSPPRRTINRRPLLPASNFPLKVTIVQTPKVNAVKGVQGHWGNPHHALKDKGVIDSRCSRHMIGNMSYLFDFEEINGGYVTFGGNPKGGNISGKGKIRTGKLDFDDVYFVKELKFNLFSISHIVPRENNMYNVDLKNIVPSGDLTCLFAKATLDESNLWHRRLGHINFKTMNKLVKVVTDDYSRFTWVFFLATKDEPSPILKTFITGIENQLSLKVKIIRSDNGTEFKNQDLNQFCGMKGIKREFSVPRTPQQNGIAEGKNRILIEAARTMLADLLLSIPFWAEAVNTACYVQNRVLVTKPHNKTPYELLLGRTPSIGFMRPFGCLVTILNTLDPLGSGPTWLFDIDTLTKFMNYQPVTADNQSNPSAGVQKQFDAEKAGEENVQQYVLFPLWSSGSKDPQNTDGDATFEVKEPEFEGRKSESEVHVSPSNSAKTKKHDDKTKREAKGKSPVESSTGYRNLSEKFEDFFDNSINEVKAVNMPALEDITYSDDEEDVATQTRSMTRVVKDQGGLSQINNEDFHTCMFACFLLQEEPKRVHQALKDPSWIEAMQEELLQFMIQKVWILVDLSNGKRAIGFMVYQMDVKSTFLYRTIKEEVYGYQPLGFEDLDYLDKVYKVVKALYGLHQAPRAWYKTLANYLLENGFQRGKIDQTLFIKKQKGDILLKPDGIFISQDKYVAKILRKFGLTDGKSASTPIDTEKPLLKDPDGEDVDVVGKGFSGVETPLFEGMIVAQQADDVADEGAAGVDVDDIPAADVEPSIPSPTPTTQPPPPSQELLSTSQLKQRVKKLERKNKVKISRLKRLKTVRTAQRIESSEDTVMDDVSKQGEIIAHIDADEDVILKDVDVVAKENEIAENAYVQGRLEESQAQIYKIDLEHADKVLSMQDDDAALTITTTPSAARRRKGVVIRDPEECATPSIIIHFEPKSKDKGKEIMRKDKEDNDVLMYQALKSKPQTEAQARKNIMIYLKNMAGFKMDYFKGMIYDDIIPIFEKYFNLNVAFLEKTKEQLEEEESKALKRKTEKNNKPYFKIIRADETHQLFMNFLRLLRNFDREDLELDVEAQVWKSQRGVYGLAKVKSWRLLESCRVHVITLTTTQMILLVERRYPLTWFTLDQMLNNVRLEVKERSEVSLDLLRFGLRLLVEDLLLLIQIDAAADIKLRLLEQIQVVSDVQIVKTVSVKVNIVTYRVSRKNNVKDILVFIKARMTRVGDMIGDEKHLLTTLVVAEVVVAMEAKEVPSHRELVEDDGRVGARGEEVNGRGVVLGVFKSSLGENPDGAIGVVGGS
uniref:Putative ribonuclease H-like domain-containing protein n=1 Tax=Tanacetum cinerariifolium TaxID=118510 RepID=A0A6L2L6D5_TANCI|nr:putative ribonuclease H-like domain-containing protein [Tanacetum cinerariifolium]